jgi:hypothetical protein
VTLPQRLPAVSSQDQGQGRASIPLYSRGLLPRRLIPRPRRPQCPAPPLARHGCQSARARDHPARRQRGVCRGKAGAQVVAACPIPDGIEARTAPLPRRHGERAAISTAFPTRPGAASSTCTCSPTRSLSSRVARSLLPTFRSKAATRSASIRRIARPRRRGKSGGLLASVRSGVPATRSLDVRSTSTKLSPADWPGER